MTKWIRNQINTHTIHKGANKDISVLTRDLNTTLDITHSGHQMEATLERDLKVKYIYHQVISTYIAPAKPTRAFESEVLNLDEVRIVQSKLTLRTEPHQFANQVPSPPPRNFKTHKALAQLTPCSKKKVLTLHCFYLLVHLILLPPTRNL